MKMKEITGLRFNRLVAVECLGSNNRKEKVWRCKCDCGSEANVASYALRTGVIKSCGCLRDETRVTSNTTHGMSDTLIYGIWKGMMGRCYRETEPAYDRYGGRGIKVCLRWQRFENFFADMGHRPDGMTLERKNNNKGYSPGNCKWATWVEQARNKRNNRMITHDGETRCLAEWAELTGLKTPTLFVRLYRYGWTVEKAITTTVVKNANGRTYA